MKIREIYNNNNNNNTESHLFRLGRGGMEARTGWEQTPSTHGDCTATPLKTPEMNSWSSPMLKPEC